METIHDTFAENMRKYRKRAGMTQEDLAEKCGLHRTYIGGIEQRRINVSLRNVQKIADALEINPALLFMYEPSERQSTQQPQKHQGAIAHQGFSEGDYAICSWHGERITIEPISVHNEKLSISILCSLIEQGHEDDLAEAYERAQSAILHQYKSGQFF